MISPAERAASDVFHDLPPESRDVIQEWLSIGHNMRDAILRSNALGSGPLMTPRDAWKEDLRINGYREAAEHESNHAVVAYALGLNVKSAKISEDGEGECTYVKGTKLQRAIILMAPQLWIDRFCRDSFPYGAKGLKSDNRGLAEIGDVLILREAMDHCMAILRQNRALVLAANIRTAESALAIGQCA
jgi:hypothetical protein